MEHEAVFHALADPSRRRLLDQLFTRDGRTLKELEAELPMTRFGVMKHLIATRKLQASKFAIVAPAMLLPSLLGARIYRGLSPLAFRRVVLLLLSAAGLAMVAAGLPALLRR